jgi:hypothetical protein
MEQDGNTSRERVTVMPSRRSFLQSVLFLPSALSAHAFAQDTAKQTAPVSLPDGEISTPITGVGSFPPTTQEFPRQETTFCGRSSAVQ